MRNFIKSSILLTAMVFVFISCTKDDNDDDNPSNSKTNTEYLTAGYWKVTAMTVNPGIFGITDFYAQMPPCTQDDLIRFNANGTITDDEGATKCDQGDPQTVNEGTWVMSQDNQSFTIDYPDEDPITFNIVTINDNTFSGTYTSVEDFGVGPITYTYTVTMTRQ